MAKTGHNLAFSMLNLGASMLSSFLLIPIFFRSMGPEAAGYVALGLTLISVAQVFSVAITSMATRYIVLGYHKSPEEANRYFNSVYVACVVLGIVLMILFVIAIIFIPRFVNISAEYIFQMRIMVMFMAGSFCLTVLACPFLAAQYYKQDLRIMYSFQAANQIARVIAPALLFPIVGPKLWIPYAAAFAIDLIAFVVYRFLRKRMMPNITLSLSGASMEAVQTVLSGGIWASVNKAGAILLSSVSTYLANIFVGKTETGFYASFMQLQRLFAGFTNAAVSALVPNLIALYAREDKNAFYSTAVSYMRLLGIALGVVCGIALTYELDFFKLWLGTSADEYALAAFLLIAYLPFTYPSEILNQVIILQVRVKVPALFTLFVGALSLVFSAIFCLAFQMGLTGIAIAQIISQMLRAWAFLPYYVSRPNPSMLSSFFKAAGMGPAALVATFVISRGLSMLLPTANNWLWFFFDCIICLIICGIAVVLLLSSSEKQMILGKIKHIHKHYV